MVNPDFYDEAYFECGIFSGISLYVDYQWLPELTIPFCAELIAYLGISHSDTILDFGCAKGYMVKAFRLLNRRAFGVDISEYAISCVPEDMKLHVTLINSPNEIPLLPSPYDWIIAKDVFEHVRDSELKYLLEKLRPITHHLFAITPLGDGKRFLDPREEKDISHQTRESLFWWRDRFDEAGFTPVALGHYLPYILELNRRKGWILCA